MADRQVEGYLACQDSCMFRRGGNKDAPEMGFLDIVSALEELKIPSGGNLKMLVIGVAHGEEPLSLLSVLKELLKKQRKSIDHDLDLRIVDIRPPLTASEIKGTAYIIGKVGRAISDQDFFRNNFSMVNAYEWRVSSELIGTLVKKIQDPGQLWHTDVRDYVWQETSEQYHVITYNNTHGHVPNTQDKLPVIEGLLKRLSPGGIFITDDSLRDPIKHHPQSERLMSQYGLTRISDGIYKRADGSAPITTSRFASIFSRLRKQPSHER